MKKINDTASIAPLVVVFLIIVIGGLLIGILGVIMSAISNEDNNINTFFYTVWGFIGVIVLIVLVSWAIVKAQREG
jgi:MFS-type transporter involved in bile tolerance (Atg22 family)